MSVVTFDFDGVLHTDVQGIHPTDWNSKGDQTPAERMIRLFKQEARDHDVVIVTARGQGHVGMIRKFAEMHGLNPVTIIATDDRPKMPVLRRLESIRHYDDNRQMIRDILPGDSIEFVLVSDDQIIQTIKAAKKIQDAAKVLEDYLTYEGAMGSWVSKITVDQDRHVIVLHCIDDPDAWGSEILDGRSFMGFKISTDFSEES